MNKRTAAQFATKLAAERTDLHFGGTFRAPSTVLWAVAISDPTTKRYYRVFGAEHWAIVAAEIAAARKETA